MGDGKKEGRSGDERGCCCDGTQGRASAGEVINGETPQGNRIGRGEGAVGGQGRGGEDGGVKWITL